MKHIYLLDAPIGNNNPTFQSIALSVIAAYLIIFVTSSTVAAFSKN